MDLIYHMDDTRSLSTSKPKPCVTPHLSVWRKEFLDLKTVLNLKTHGKFFTY